MSIDRNKPISSIGTLEMNPKVDYTGPQNDSSDLLQSLNIYLMMTRRNGWVSSIKIVLLAMLRMQIITQKPGEEKSQIDL